MFARFTASGLRGSTAGQNLHEENYFFLFGHAASADKLGKIFATFPWKPSVLALPGESGENFTAGTP
ncbi:MAG: hypothetical protein DMG99_10325 [Acidobacteria bacterium]|nr:MAG: hypothetical protein DMG99_10325 [Acidobacteriota bacterium]